MRRPSTRSKRCLLLLVLCLVSALYIVQYYLALPSIAHQPPVVVLSRQLHEVHGQGGNDMNTSIDFNHDQHFKGDLDVKNKSPETVSPKLSVMGEDSDSLHTPGDYNMGPLVTHPRPHEPPTSRANELSRHQSVVAMTTPYAQKNHTVRNNSSSPCSMTLDTVQKVRKFIFFIGYPRSGHSIVASLLDAHSRIIIAHEFSLFTWWSEYKEKHRDFKLISTSTKHVLFDALSNNSYQEAIHGERSGHYVNKGYSLNTNSPWHGRCDGFVQVIGDKRAGGTSLYYQTSPKAFNKSYQELLELVNVPVGIFHIVRNPYDLISTSMLYEAARLNNGGKVTGDNADFVTRIKNRAKSRPTAKYRDNTLLEERIDVIFKLADAVLGMIDISGVNNVIEVHNCDLVKEPAGVVMKMCEFLGVDCPLDYVQTCVEKTFKTVSKSRDLIVWPQHLKAIVEERKHKYPFFHRYTFDGDC